jgi:hypothetical protein
MTEISPPRTDRIGVCLPRRPAVAPQQSQRRTARAVLGALLALTLAACSGASIGDSLPGPVGLPEGAPARPQQALEYPAVHDMPPERETTTLTPAQRDKLEADLITARERVQHGQPPPRR